MTERSIACLLVANRGEIASRVFRTARSMGIRTVAVFSDADTQMPFVGDADLAVHLPGSVPADTYLRVDLMLDAARQSGADAVHPGYGFLAENATFAQAVLDAGLIWVGPPPSAIAAMGSKIEAKARMRSHGVPVLPEAMVGTSDSPEQLAEAAEAVGYPLLVKASAGGGGRGMRIVRSPAELADATASAVREAVSAFGDGTVFLERYIEGGRHVEIQVIADQHGACASLHERECSIQRRHQKIIEEAPSPAVTPALRQRMGEAAVAAARAVGYEGAGTVEMLLDANGQFAFLEMNTRLQVEHPVTELVTGLDLVALQLLVAAGGHLPPDALAPPLHGHAVEARLYAEDPAADYHPSVGTLHHIEIPERIGIRVDSGVASGVTLSPFYDPLLAKVVAWAPTRAQAARSLASALESTVVAGVATNREQLIDVLRHPAFLAGHTSTSFLDEHRIVGAGADPGLVRVLLASAALAEQAERREAALVLRGVPSGWRNNPSQPQYAQFELAGVAHEVYYRLERSGALAELSVDGESLGARLVEARPDQVVLEIGAVQRRVRVIRHAGTLAVVTPGASATLRVLPRFVATVEPGLEGSLVAPMPGSIARLAVEVGAFVSAGDALVVIEAMKMEHAIRSPIDGVVAQVLIAVGQQVDAGQALLVLTPHVSPDPSVPDPSVPDPSVEAT